ncbi:hypothetical protein COCNU_scaffold006775G000020 [Cocos nucifera]|nr:hypothetical protein [Cocos nucifera]
MAKGMEEYMASNDFRSKVAKSTTFVYHIGFKECLKKVKKSFSKVDTSGIVPRVRELTKSEDKEGDATSPEKVAPLDVAAIETTIIMVVEAPTPDQALADVSFSTPALSKATLDIPSLALDANFDEDLTKDQSSQKKLMYFDHEEKILKAMVTASKIRAIAESISMFFCEYKMGFNHCIMKVKKFFPNIDLAFLTLTDIDVMQLY